MSSRPLTPAERGRRSAANPDHPWRRYDRQNLESRRQRTDPPSERRKGPREPR